jgi:hypothetical protein
MKYILFIILAVFFMYTHSYADVNRWKEIKKDKDATYYIDSNSIVKSKTTMVNFWVKITRHDIFFYDNKKVNYYLDNYDINCKTYNFKELDMLVFDDNNNVINRSPSRLPIEYKIIPETMMDFYYNYICKVK